MKKMLIIGAGVAGLSTGCYAQMNGYDSEIYEMHSTPGGVCTSWKRGDYLFDHCLHWVLGSNKGSSIYPVFEELGVAQNVKFYFTERFRKIELKGKILTVY
ncbi:MAG TPA: FAD/NAD(P)-binding protein, partial [Candidatus Humimicrobiaceae bacterium]